MPEYQTPPSSFKMMFKHYFASKKLPHFERPCTLVELGFWKAKCTAIE